MSPDGRRGGGLDQNMGHSTTATLILGSGCGIVVEHLSHIYEFVGSIPAECFFSIDDVIK